MDDVLAPLENKITKLLDQYQTLTQTNLALEQANTTLRNEKEYLLQQLQEAISYIEKMLNQLKTTPIT